MDEVCQAKTIYTPWEDTGHAQQPWGIINEGLALRMAMFGED